jgi:outer membrane cobalamin receptor
MPIQFNSLLRLTVIAGCLYAPLSTAVDVDELFAMDLEQLLSTRVETANKSSQKATDAAAVIEVITQQDIKNFGGNNLLEVLDRATSISMSGTFFFPQNSASMRGGISTGADHHVLLLINGRPMRDSFSGGENFAFYTAFPIQIIKQIEIIRGPGSVLYGSNAFTGVINIITQQPGDEHNKVTLTGGSFNSAKFQASASIEKGDFKMLAGMHLFKEDGWNFSATDNNRIDGSFDTGEDNLGAVINATYANFELNGFYIKSSQDFWGTTSTWSTANPTPTSSLDIESKRTLIDLGYNYQFDELRYVDVNVSYGTQDFSHINYDSQSKNTFIELVHHWQITPEIDWLIGGTSWSQDVTSFDGARAAPVDAFQQTWHSFYTQAELQQTEQLMIGVIAVSIVFELSSCSFSYESLFH